MGVWTQISFVLVVFVKKKEREPARIARYLTGRVLGVGGFGVTYMALDMTLEAPVAVKEYLPSGLAIRDNDHYSMTITDLDEQEKFDAGVTKFLDEARILAKLRSVPTIVSVHDYFRENNTAYFVMEYVDGVDLAKYTKAKGGKISFEEMRTLFLPIIDALGAVHAQNLLHRDISPDNILVMRNGSPRILDFGAARQAVDSGKSKSIILKHGFAPEEQYRKHGNQGPWSDEYALAATMYLVLTGNYGSGKTELALNLAMQFARTYKTTLVDLDIVNPYFRSGEKATDRSTAARILKARLSEKRAIRPLLPLHRHLRRLLQHLLLLSRPLHRRPAPVFLLKEMNRMLWPVGRQ